MAIDPGAVDVKPASLTVPCQQKTATFPLQDNRFDTLEAAVRQARQTLDADARGAVARMVIDKTSGVVSLVLRWYVVLDPDSATVTV
jgi:hypothetical protein